MTILYNEVLKEQHLNLSYLNGDDPVGGILNVENRKTYTISAAHDENLISKKQAIMMLEAQVKNNPL